MRRPVGRGIAMAAAILFAALPLAAAIPSQERAALEAIYHALDGPNWRVKSGWLGAPGSECTWSSVTCDAGASTVTALDLAWNNARGVLPRELGDLPNLEVLQANGSTITGTLPPEIGKLSRLRILDLTGYYDNIGLSGNEISGPIPAELGQLTSLEELYLDANQVTGPIPGSLASLSNLKILSLSYNPMEGPIPPQLMQRDRLQRLRLDKIRLNGPIPPVDLPALVELRLTDNALTGELPAGLGQSRNLQYLVLAGNQLSGPLPDLGGLTALVELSLYANSFSGPLPPWIGNLRELTDLWISSNSFSGDLPAELFTLPKLQALDLRHTQLSGDLNDFGSLTTLEVLLVTGEGFRRSSFPAELTRLVALTDLEIVAPLGGALPPEIGQLTNLRSLRLEGTQLTGPLPNLSGLVNLENLYLADNRFEGRIPDFSTLTKLQFLSLHRNELEGPIPPEIVALPALRQLRLSENRLSGGLPDLRALRNLEVLYLEGNQFSGPVPEWLGSHPSLVLVRLERNKLAGVVPAAVAGATGLNEFTVDFNALRATDPAVRTFLASFRPDWESTQTVAPSDLRVTALRERSVTLSWTPIVYRDGPGGYLIGYSTSPGGPFEILTTTPNKQTQTFIADGLQPSTDYSFSVSTVTYPHGDQQNVVVSDTQATVSTRTTTGAPAAASVVVFVYPGEIRQRPGGTESTSYVLGNVGDLPAQITLTQRDDLFTQEPSSLTLAGGETRRITVTGKPLAAGAYASEALIAGTGVPSGLSVRVSILVADPPAGTVSAQPSANRIDVAAAISDGASGSVDFRNVGTATLRGVVVSNVAWIIPPSELIVIPAGESRTVTFQVDQSKRPDAASPAGAVTGTLSLVYESGSAATGRDGTHSSHGISLATPVTVVYTITPPVQSVTFPPLEQGEVALFIAAVGHAVGARGLFISDVAIVNAFGVNSPTDVRMYYSPSDPSLPSKVTQIGNLEPNQGITFGNVVKSVFDNSNIGTIQLRTRSLDQLFVNANIFNVTDRAGTYGTALPLFRSDRALLPGQSLYLTGLRRDASRATYTNIFLQETSGANAQYAIDFYGPDGGHLGQRTGSLSPFRLGMILDAPDDPAVLVGAVSARVTNSADSAGRLVAFATPYDNQSGDFWIVADWNRELNAPADEPMIIPVAGSLRGALDTFYKTDVAVTNRSASPSAGTFTFYPQAGSPRTTEVAVAAGESLVVDDFVGSSFPELGNTFGFLEFAPRSGSFGLSSRTFATTPRLAGTFGTGVPVLPRAAALRLGQSKIIAGLDVASVETIGAGKPGTFRTNVGLVETAGLPATVQVTVIYSDIRQLASGIRLTTVTYELAPYGSIIDSIAAKIRATNPNVADLRSVQLKFKVTAGEGAVIVYTASVDNGTQDQVLRIE